MILASRSAAISHSTDPVAHSVRGFIAASARLETRSHAKPSTSGKLDLGRLYPSIFGVREQPALASGSAARAASAAMSAAAATPAAFAGIFRH